MIYLLRFFLVVTLLALPLTATAEQARDISWDDLAAPTPPEIQEQIDALMNLDPADTRTYEQLDAWWRALQEEAYPVVEEIDGENIRIPGFVVPIDLEASVVREFLLVPYMGACIHSPPPPPNQVIYVNSPLEYTVEEQFDPVWVTGRIKIATMNTDLAETGYILNADEIIRYVAD